MRRFRESGIVTILLLGLTGCAGVQQRLGWTELPSHGDESSEDRPLSRLAFWRRHRAEETNSASDLAERGRSAMIASNGSSEDDEERPGLLRRLPLVGRLWKSDHRDESDELDMPAARYARNMLSSPSVAVVPPGSQGAGIAPRTRPAVDSTIPGTPVADNRPAGANPPASPPTASAGSEPADEPPLRELSVDLAGTRPQVDSAAVPAANPGAPPPLTALPDSQPQPQQRSLPEPPAVPSIGREAAPPPPSATPGAQPSLPTPDLSPANANRGPSLPSPSVSSPPESGSSPAPESSTPMLVSTPGPVLPVMIQDQANLIGSGQSVVMSSSQGGYVSAGCDVPCGPKCKTHKLCPFKKHKQMIASSVVYPTGQGMVSSCEDSVPCKVKKECFLKRWLHHKGGCKNKRCKGCKSCAYCGEPAAMVSAQGPIVSPQF